LTKENKKRQGFFIFSLPPEPRKVSKEEIVFFLLGIGWQQYRKNLGLATMSEIAKRQIGENPIYNH